MATEATRGQDPDVHLRHAVELARRNLDSGDGGPFGAVIVRGDRVLAAASNQVLRRNDPTAHAEVEAIRAACAAAGDVHLTGATLYSSCEPCPMCLAAACWAHIDRIVYAASRDDAASVGFIDAEIYQLLAADDSGEVRLRREHRPMAEAAAVMRAWNRSAARRDY